jgi:hypothetical protein
MHETQVEERVETREKESPVRESAVKSSFNDVEYERWSQNLRNKGKSKGN